MFRKCLKLKAIDRVSRELLEEAKAGSYVEPENAEEYERVIREYLMDPDLLKIQGENGYSYAKDKFDRKVLAKRYLKRIENL